MSDRVPEWMMDRILVVVEAASDAFGVPCSDILSRKQHRPISDARAAAMYYLIEVEKKSNIWTEKNYSLVKIGCVFGRHHSAITNAIQKVKDLLDYDLDMEFSKMFNVFLRNINARSSQRPGGPGPWIDPEDSQAAP